MKHCGTVLALALILAGCVPASPQVAPSPPAAATTPATTPAAQPTPEAPVYPGARITNRMQFSGSGPLAGFGEWTMLTLETDAPFERVRDFYRVRIPSGWTATLTSATEGERGRAYAVWMTRPDGRGWYVVLVQEDRGTGRVQIAVSVGTAPP